MNKLKSACTVLVCAVFAVACTKNSTISNAVKPTPVSPVTPVAADTTYTMIWSDEFSGTAVDSKVWNMATGPNGANNEEEYYQPQNATVVNGNLVITAKAEKAGTQLYTSARMNTLDKVSAQYGRIEARIKLPLGQGLWPAFWMMGTNINTVSWPNCGEIDIMEHVNADNIIYGTIHWNGGNGHVHYGQNTTISSPDDYHLYAIAWDKNEIRWYIDKTIYVRANIKDGINNTGAFQKPFFILLNLAVGGDFPGQTIDTTRLPASMYVDYVRVYKQN